MQHAQHITSDAGRDIQLAVHEIAKTWTGRGICVDCIIRQIIHGASAVAQDARSWSVEAVQETVGEAFSSDITHIQHPRH